MSAATRIDTAIDHYSVLGLQRDASRWSVSSVVERAFGLVYFMRSVGAHAEADRLELSVNEASRCLSDVERRAEYDEAHPGAGTSPTLDWNVSFQIQTFDCVFRFEKSEHRMYGWVSWELVLILPRSAFDFVETRLSELPYAVRIDVLAEDGAVIASGVRHAVVFEMRQVRRESSLESYRDGLTQLRAGRDLVASKDLPLDRLNDLIERLSYLLRGRYWSNHGTQLTEVHAAYMQAAAELQRLNGDPAEIVLEAVMSGRILYWGRDHNNRILGQIQAWWIRTGGNLDLITPIDLERFFRDKLDGAATVTQMQACDLRLRLEDYVEPRAITELAAEGLLDLAPEFVELAGRKSSAVHRYPIEYGYAMIDGHEVPVGVLMLPLGVYEHNADEHGKSPTIPELPHGTRMVIKVTAQDRLVFWGLRGEQIERRYKRYKGAKQRSGIVPNEDDIGFNRRSPLDGSAVPPWCVSRRAGRWR